MAVTQFINSDISTLENTSYLSIELDSLAIDGVVLGAAINNSSTRQMMMEIWIDAASADLSTPASPGVVIRLVGALGSSSTAFEDNDDAAYAVTLPFNGTGTEPKAHVRKGLLSIPPGYFKLAVVNKTDVIFASSGNVLGYAPYTPETDI